MMDGVTQSLFIGGLCWLLALLGVTYDVCVSQRWRSSWWVIATLLFGPLAAALYLITGMFHRHPRSRHAAGVVGASRIHPTRLVGTPRYEISPPTLPTGSGLFLFVRLGAMQDAYHSSEIPPHGVLTVRRARYADDRAKMGELLLHDLAVSRNQHCRLWRAGNEIVLEDLSTNGTFVEDQHVVHGQIAVAIGSTIQIGKTELLLCDERQIFPTVLNR